MCDFVVDRVCHALLPLRVADVPRAELEVRALMCHLVWDVDGERISSWPSGRSIGPS